MDSLAVIFATVVVTGFICQWLAWRLKVPAILFLLIAGMLAGPALGAVDPDALLGDLLFPIVSMSVAIILFEGSLTLRWEQIQQHQAVVRKLATIGAVITWFGCALTSYLLFAFTPSMALLFGTLVVVTGPTVIVPMLRTIRPNRNIASVLRWEGIVIDPIGALLAVVVFEYILATSTTEALLVSTVSFVRILGIGTLVGLLSAIFLRELLIRRWLPEFLHNFGTIAVVIGSFTLSNSFEHESGLLTVTVMGIALGNMRDIHVEDILSFKENLTLLLISMLFILLAARIDLDKLMAMGWATVALIATLHLVIRPIAVWVCSMGSELNWRERTMISWIGPRGIVAAAVSSLFALKLEQNGVERADELVTLTFAVIIGTVLLQSLTSTLVATLLRVREPSARGVLISGANPIARALGQALEKNGFAVMLVSANYEHVKEARQMGLPVFYGNPISGHADTHLDLIGIGKLLAVSPYREENVLASMRYRPEFGRDNIFALKTSREASLSSSRVAISEALKGQHIAGGELNYRQFLEALNDGASIKTTKLTENFDWAKFAAADHNEYHALFAIDRRKRLHVFTQQNTFLPKPGWSIISLALPKNEQGSSIEHASMAPAG